MNHKQFIHLITLIFAALLLVGCSPAGGPVSGNRDVEPPANNDTPTGSSNADSGSEADDATETNDEEETGLANPASVYCEEQGGTVEMRRDADGGQYGVCIFPDGSECEEWAFFRGECAPGGTQLFDTLWVLQSIDGESPLADTTPTLRITADGQYGGSTGCNNFFGSFTREGEDWQMSAPGQNDMFCEDVMEQETAVLTHLQNVTHHTLATDSLTLHTPEGDLVYAPAEHTVLEDTTWTLTGINQGEAVVSTWIDTEIYVQFQDGSVGGSTGCNSFTGSYEIDGDALTLSPLALTRRACDEEHDARESELVEALSRVAGYRTELDTLTLLDAEGSALATFSAAAPPAELAGSRWELQSYGGKSPLADAPVTLEFVEEGQLSGNAGCNRFFGSYELDAGNFSVGPLGSTEMWCEGAMEQETAVLNMLQNATNLIHEGDTLTINTSEGELVLTLAP